MISGSIHNSTLATRQFVKTSIYWTSWTHHIYTYIDNIASVDHCALWCRIEPHYCELFYLEGTRCWYGYRDRVTYTDGPKGLSPVDVYWDPGKFSAHFWHTNLQSDCGQNEVVTAGRHNFESRLHTFCPRLQVLYFE